MSIRNGWVSDATGAYVPRILTAFIESGSEYLDLNKLHEFIGHGLFFEYHTLGRKIARSEKKGRQVSIPWTVRGQSELFAVWCEQFFGHNYGLGPLFARRYPKGGNSSLYDQLDIMNKLRERLGLFGMFGSLGFPKYYGPARVRTLVNSFFSPEQLERTRCVILYGSQEPYSDIDLFCISDVIHDQDFGWLDIVAKTEREFEEQVKMCGVAIRGVVTQGRCVYGDADYLSKCRRRWKHQPISGKAIRYNISKHKHFKDMASDSTCSPDVRVRAAGYARTYLEHALRLKKGDR